MSIDAKNCIAFEDSEMGLLSARAANLKTVITVSEYTKLHRFDDAMVVLDNLGEKNKPFNIIKGASTNASYVNVNYLKELYEQSS
jgi:beta-phosphoglucomutase-like phosphatase (HAD superfamily)